MPTNIFIAKKPTEIDSVFLVRHKVFCEEEGLLTPNKDKRLIDRYDAMPSTKNLVVEIDNKIIGSMRLTLDSEIGLPADKHYNFRDILPNDAHLLHTGMFCVSQEFRNPRLTSDLLSMCCYYGISKGATHVVAPINPQIANLLKRIGFEVVGEEFIDPTLNTPMLPLVLDAENLKDYFINFVNKNKLQDFIGDYERSFYKKDEFIITAGEKGKYAYLIIEGVADVTLPNSSKKIAQLEEGEVFGELALLTDEVRSTNVIAQTNVQVMKLSKEIFVKYFFNEPRQAQKLLKLMGERTQDLIKKLEAAIQNKT